jgi:hypothetical protein
VFPVRYGLNFYIKLWRNSVFKGLIHLHFYYGPSKPTSLLVSKISFQDPWIWFRVLLSLPSSHKMSVNLEKSHKFYPNITILRNWGFHSGCYEEYHPSGIWGRVARWLSTDVSEEHIASIFRVKEISSAGRLFCFPPACLLVFAKLISSTLKMEAICSSETSVVTQQTTRRHIPEYDTLHHDIFMAKLICNNHN